MVIPLSRQGHQLYVKLSVEIYPQFALTLNINVVSAAATTRSKHIFFT